jgi:glucose/arabinose dehydrogenase/PKD repeat protein
MMLRPRRMAAALGLVGILAGCVGDSEPPTDLTATSATFHAWGVPSTTATVYFFKYGTSPQFGQETPRRFPTGLTPNTRYPIVENVTGLTPATRYYYTICGKEQSDDDSKILCGNTEVLVTSLPTTDYQQVTLAIGGAELGENAMSIAVLPNRSVVHTARSGTVRITDAAGNTKVAGQLGVYTHDEEGLQGVAADPNFAVNRFIYLYYSPLLSTPAGDAPVTGTQADFDRWKGVARLSRFTLRADDTLDPASETVLLDVPQDRGICCHMGGDLDFDKDGNLYLTTGDDTNPWGDAAGYAPIDERPDRNPAFDAQRSSANTNDLRGKLLRIHPQPDGTYTIPPGNLFAPGTAKTRPEIYAMGFRNPFRMSVDRPTGIVYLGEYGPDALTASERGPAGQVEFDRITGPGNYGWPYCTGTNTPAETYSEWTFPSGPAGALFDCAGGPTNNSFRNTGLAKLPAAQPSWIKYGDDANSPPEFDVPPTPGRDSQSPMGGPVYHFDPALASPVKFPATLDGMYFAAEFGRKWIKAIAVNPSGSRGGITAFPWAGTQVIDTAFGPDGALYVLDFGVGFANNQALYRIEFVGGRNRNPIAKASADRTSGIAPLTVAFSSAGSFDPEGGAPTYSWSFGDGGTSTQANPSHTYTVNGTYSPTVTVRDPAGLTATASLVVTVGNTAPTVSLVAPGDGKLFSFGDAVPFQVAVTDPEDGAVDCARVKVTYFLGHDDHQHQMTTVNGCTGSVPTSADAQHTGGNIYGVVDAEYTDNGGLTTHSVHKLQPRHRQAEHFGAMAGVQIVDMASAEGNQKIGFIENGDWISFQPYLLSGVTGVSARVASGGAGGTIEVRAGSTTGPLLGSLTVPVTGSYGTWTTISAGLGGAPSGTTTLFLVFKGGAGFLFDLDAFTFTGG